MAPRRLPGVCVFGLLMACGALQANSEDAAPAAAPAAQASENPNGAAWAAASAAMIRGPTEVALRDQARIALPEGFGLVPLEEATKLMQVMGNTVNDYFMGVIFPLSDTANWFVSLDFVGEGYIKDDEARDWDADQLLQSLKDGTEVANQMRAEQGIAPLEVTHWVEKPSYSANNHRLVGSAEARLKGAADPDPTINYNTYLLGMDGYIELNLITSASHVEVDKVAARQLRAATSFVDGNTDKVAAYGLGAAFAKWFRSRNRKNGETSA